MGADDSLQDRRNRNHLIDSQRRIANALERIATAMEAQAESSFEEEMDSQAVLDATEDYVLGRYVEALNRAGFKVVRGLRFGPIR